MKIEDEVCSLDFSKMLKDCGVKRDSLFKWQDYGKDTLLLTLQDDKIIWEKNHVNVLSATRFIGEFPAYTVAELGVMLGELVNDISYSVVTKKFTYVDVNNAQLLSFDTEADARASYLIQMVLSHFIKNPESILK